MEQQHLSVFYFIDPTQDRNHRLLEQVGQHKFHLNELPEKIKEQKVMKGSEIKPKNLVNFPKFTKNATKIIISGDLIVDAKKLPGVPRFMAGKIASTIEKFVVTTIKPNLTNDNPGLEQYLKDHTT